MICYYLLLQSHGRHKTSVTSLTDDEGSYQSWVNVFDWSDVGVVEFGQAVAVVRSRAVVVWDGPLVRQHRARCHRVIALQVRSSAIGIQGSCGQRSTESHIHQVCLSVCTVVAGIRWVTPHPRCSCCSSVRAGGCCKAWMLRSSGARSPCLPALPSVLAPRSPSIVVSPLLSCRWRHCTACTRPSCRSSRCAGVFSLKRQRPLWKDKREMDAC